MPFLNTIVDQINDTLQKGTLSTARFQANKFFNIASTFEKEGIVSPGVINYHGEIDTVVPDDRYAVQVYHKVIGNVYGREVKKSYGDSVDITCISEMQCFVFGLADKIRMQAEELETYIVFGMPAQLLLKQMRSCIISVSSSDMDKVRNFRNEFQNIKNFLAPEHIFFSVRYQIKTVFDRDCVFECVNC